MARSLTRREDRPRDAVGVRRTGEDLNPPCRYSWTSRVSTTRASAKSSTCKQQDLTSSESRRSLQFTCHSAGIPKLQGVKSLRSPCVLDLAVIPIPCFCKELDLIVVFALDQARQWAWLACSDNLLQA